MLQLGGRFGRAILARLAERFPAPTVDWDAVDPHTTSGLRRFFGDDQLATYAGKRVLDFGCGRGADAVAAALAGASEVVGIDVQAHHIESARALAERFGVSHICRFIDARSDRAAYAALDGGFDVVFTIDSFEHYDDPVFILGEMDRLLAPSGTLVISFGPPWKHPFGAHLTGWIKLPWIHFFFDEPTVLAVRAHYLDDGARRYEDVGGGLNRMTIARFKEIIAASPFRLLLLDPVPIRPLRPLARIPKMREYVTSVVRAVCVRSGDARGRAAGISSRAFPQRAYAL